MLTKTKCWFESNHKIVPKLKEQYILKKDLSYEYEDKSQCRFDRGMVCELYSYNADEGLELRIDSRTMPINWYEDCNTNTIFFHPMSAKLDNAHPTAEQQKEGVDIAIHMDLNDSSFRQYKVSEFYDYFEELDKELTMADALDVRQAMDKFYSAVRELNRAIDEMDGDCNSLIVDDYPFPHSYDEWVIGFYDWYNSVDENINAYRHAIKSLGGKNEE